MNKQIVKGVWFRDLVIYVGDDVYWSVILCLIFLCFSGIYFAIVGPLSDVPKWILIFLFSLLFFAAGSNQGFIWRLYIPGQIKSNKFIAYSMYADRLIALGILVLGIIYFEESGATSIQVLLFFNALLFYACTFAAYQDPPILHPGLFYPLHHPGLWFAFCTNMWHINLGVIFLSLL